MTAECQKDGAENHDDANFDQRGPVLKVGALACAPDVYRGDDGDHGDRQNGLAKGGERNDFREVFRESASQCGDRAAGDNQEEAPAIKESRDAAKAVANETVESASFGICGREFSIGQCAEEREGASDDPDQWRVTDRTV